MNVHQRLAAIASFVLIHTTVLGDVRQGQFDATGNYAGSSAALTLSATINPAPADIGQAGSYYIAAIAGGQLILMQPNGTWLPFDGKTVPAAASGTLGPRTIALFSGLNVSSVECASVIAGYGKDSNDLLLNGLYRTIYQVPAQLPHSSPLPCSAMTDADIARFLEQASFGPTDASIAEVKQLGLAGWITKQMSLPKTGYTPPGGGTTWPYYPEAQAASCSYDGNSSSAASICARDNYSLYHVQRQFLQNAISAPDQLRQRVAFALS